MDKPPRLHLFGVPELRDGTGAVIKLRTKKQLGLLVYLVLEATSRSIPRERLNDLLWTDAAPAHGRHSLAQALTAIRGALGSASLNRGGDAVRCLANIRTDMDEVIALHSGMDLDHPLDRVDTWAGAEFGLWVEGARQRCTDVVRRTLEVEIESSRSRGAIDHMIECGKALVRVDAFSSMGIRALAEEALQKGDISRATLVVRSHVHAVREALGIPVNSDMSRLLANLEAGTHPPLGRKPDRLEEAIPSADTLHFVGREDDLAWLESKWKQTCRGAPARCLLSGSAGIGKTSLFRMFAAGLAARASTVLSIGCHEMGNRIPFAAAVQLINVMSNDPRLSETDPMWLAEAARIFPTLKAMYPGIPQAPPASPEAIRVRLADALYHMVNAVRQDEPAALFFDDVHQMDTASKEVLFLLEQRLSASPVAILATCRSDPDDRGFSQVDHSMWSEHHHLAPLPEPIAHQLVRELNPDMPTEQAESIVAFSEGNPYFIEMLLQDWEEHRATSFVGQGRGDRERVHNWQPPPTLKHVFTKGYDGIEVESQEILHILAVARRSLAIEEVGVVLSRKREEMTENLVHLFNRGIVMFEGSAVCFKNELHRAFVYHSIPEDVRKLRHRQVAGALRGGVGSDETTDALELGYHLLRGGLPEEAKAFLISGAQRAVLCGAASDAERALLSLVAASESGRDPEYQMTLARAQFAQGKHAAALRTLEQIRQRGSSASVSQIAECEILYARASIASGLLDDEVLDGTANRALSAAVATGHDSLMVEALQVAGEIAGELGNLDRLSELMIRCRRAMDTLADGHSRGVALAAMGYSHLITGDAKTALTFFDQSAQAIGLGIATPAALRTLNGAGIACTAIADREGASVRFNNALNVARRLGDAGAEAVLTRNLAALEQEFGDFGGAARLLERALALHAKQPTARYGCTIFGTAASFAIDIGALEQADPLLRRGEAYARASPVVRDTIDMVLLRADFTLARGEADAAWELLERFVLPAGRKAYALGEAARYERLLRHYTLETQGLLTYQDLCQTTAPRVARLPASGRLEVQCFDSWVDRAHQTRNAEGSVQEAIGLGLLGVLVHLGGVGCCPISVNRRHINHAESILRELRPGVDPGVPRSLAWDDTAALM